MANAVVDEGGTTPEEEDDSDAEAEEVVVAVISVVSPVVVINKIMANGKITMGIPTNQMTLRMLHRHLLAKVKKIIN